MRLLPLNLLSLIMLIHTALLSGCTPSASKTPPPTERHAVQAHRISLTDNYQVPRQFVGLVSNNQQANIGFELTGRIATIHAHEGERVTAGTLLAKLDDELLKIERRELQAQLTEVSAEMELLENNLQRMRKLVPQGYASTQSLDELDAESKALAAKQQRLEASLAANRSRLNKSALVAPFAAIINRRWISEGEVVTAGKPAFELLQQGEMEVKVGVPVRFLTLISEQSPQLQIGGKDFAASLITQGGQVDTISHTVQFRYRLPAEANAVSGQLAYLQLNEQINANGAWVPLTALTDGIRGMWNVYLIVQDEAGYHLEKRDVRVRYANQSEAFIQGAFKDNDQIVAAGLHRVAPGQRVNIASTVVGASQ